MLSACRLGGCSTLSEVPGIGGKKFILWEEGKKRCTNLPLAVTVNSGGMRGDGKGGEGGCGGWNFEASKQAF